MPQDIRAVPLQAAGVALEPLVEDHRGGLATAGADPAVWRYLPYDSSEGGFGRWFDMSLALRGRGLEAIWAVRNLADGAGRIDALSQHRRA